MKPITITLEAVPPSLNQWGGWKWGKKLRISRQWKQDVGWLAKRYRGKPLANARVKVTYVFKDNRTRDQDNYAPKWILDGLKGIVLEDDSIDHIDLDWELKQGEKDQTIIEIWEG